MAISALGYACIEASDLDAWERFAVGVMGTQARRSADGALLVRADPRDWRFRIDHGPADDLSVIGWECDNEDEFRRTLTVLGDAAAEDAALAAKRGVRGLATFTDPAGIACELFWGASERSEAPFASPMGTSGFVTDEQGLGHVVVVAPDPAGYQAFYEALGFRVSDYIDMTIGPDMVLPVTFMHCNPRHHSLAFAPAPAPKKCIHLMLQTQMLDDVGFSLDRAAEEGTPVASPLGRHSNDEMVSVYYRTPSGFDFEYGWGARTIGADWRVVRHSTSSKWGHGNLGEMNDNG